MKRSKIQVGDCCCYFLNPLVLRPRPHKWPKNATCLLAPFCKTATDAFSGTGSTSCFWFTIRAAIWSQQRDNLLILVVNSAFQLQQMFFQIQFMLLVSIGACFVLAKASSLIAPKYPTRKFSVHVHSSTCERWQKFF